MNGPRLHVVVYNEVLKFTWTKLVYNRFCMEQSHWSNFLDLLNCWCALTRV